MNAHALVVGNSAYALKKDQLANAVNDANDVAENLFRLGFTVKKVTDCSMQKFDEAVKDFTKELAHYDVGLFYFAGHGVQIENKNFLTSIDTSFADEYSIKHRTLPLDEIIDRMDKAGPKIKILILDACRDNPLQGMRSAGDLGLAPVFAPRGTLIAFSTSPGQKAQDYGAGKNSVYTGAFLKHINDEDIPIEEFFKRVRTTVYEMSKQKQISWEHTSLIGDFYFNNGQLIHSKKLPYKNSYVIDSNFKPTDSEFDKVIVELKSYDYYRQNDAVNALRRINVSNLSKDELFLLGRNILQVSCDNANATNAIMRNLGAWLARYLDDNQDNHVLNGMLFEMYFNSKGKFRTGKIKNNRMNEVFELRHDNRFKRSFTFIKAQLRPVRDHLVYIPSSESKTIPIEIIFELRTDNWLEKNTKYYQLTSIKHQGKEWLEFEHEMPISIDDAGLKLSLSQHLTAPHQLLTISSNINTKKPPLPMRVPYSLKLKR
jgi:hypothetical protein